MIPASENPASSRTSRGSGCTGSEALRSPLFVATRWSVVLSAQDHASPEAAGALGELCQTYWYPLYAFVRRSGHSKEDAEDLTQEFFARLLAKDYLDAARRERGRFRTFLLVALKRFLANEWDRRHARKRGGGQFVLPLPTDTGEQHYQFEPADVLTPERIYERRWAMTLLAQTISRLKQEQQATGKLREFEQLKGALTSGRGAISYAEAAAALSLTEGAARVAVHRLRRRFRELFRAEIAQTVAAPEQIDDELRHLLSVVGNG